MQIILHYLLHYSLQTIVGTLLYVGVSVAAVLRGKMEERLVGEVLLAEWLLSFLVAGYAAAGNLQIGIFALDALAFVAILIIAAKYFKRWLLVAASAQFVAVCVHLSKLFDPTINGWIYVTATIVCTYVVVGALAFALLSGAFGKRSA